MAFFLFRRDLRIHDNVALNAALSQHNSVTCLFVFDDVQIGPSNLYRSAKGVQFLVESLLDLQRELRKLGSDLLTLYCSIEELIELLLEQQLPVYANADYTPFARDRDRQLQQALGDLYRGSYVDYTLTDHDTIRSKSGTYYKVFKYYYQAVLDQIQNKIQINTISGQFTPRSKQPNLPYLVSIEEYYQSLPPKPDLIRQGGRVAALQALTELSGLANYAFSRDYPSVPTSVLSPFIKFGCVSIREVLQAIVDLFGWKHELVRQVVWHDFYAYIMYHSPITCTIGGGNMRGKELNWDYDQKLIQAWMEGRTGFPFMDAGMRQLVQVGWMHNRVRMLCANMFTLIFRLDWHIGERFFAQHLIDYDVSSNNGNWQWNGGVGLDHSGYLRIFNPFTQSKEYDEDCVYIKRWIPELKDVSASDIHNWGNRYALVRDGKYDTSYHAPVVDFATRRKEAMIWFK